MLVKTVTGGRNNREFEEKLAKFDDKEWRLVNICTSPSGRFIAFLQSLKAAKKPVKTKKETKIETSLPEKGASE